MYYIKCFRRLHFKCVSDKNEKYLYNEFNDILKKCSPEKQKLIYKLSQVIAEEDETYKSKK